MAKTLTESAAICAGLIVAVPWYYRRKDLISFLFGSTNHHHHHTFP